jgi:membrane-bound lytic murein transglycosylase D
VESEIREIRQLLEQQNRQLDALSRQFSALKDYVTSSGGVHPAAPATPQPSPPPTAAIAAATPPAASGSATPPPVIAAPPSTPLTAGKHVVAKGETLTSIAKRYNIPLAELEKANPIQNDRMLQIGQTLTIPSPNAPAPAPAAISPKSPEPPTQKKENP